MHRYLWVGIEVAIVHFSRLVGRETTLRIGSAVISGVWTGIWMSVTEWWIWAAADPSARTNVTRIDASLICKRILVFDREQTIHMTPPPG
ncbi:hypothetical protein BJ165DRAFT_1503048 [Panaeolus papilionaceus]|nr:hypothetical protein BJ165DRAFT_1503048 [Panaeolus papilionaceus]